MRTEAQINASRVNGAKSRGPVTPDGKAASSRNSLKHGILASNVLITGENEPAFLEFVADLFEEFQPATVFEQSLVETMAVARWRQERIWNIESSIMIRQIEREREQDPHVGQHSSAASTAFENLGNRSRTLDLIIRYESRFARQYLRAHKRFMEVRAARLKSAPPSDDDNPNVIPINSSRGAATGGCCAGQGGGNDAAGIPEESKPVSNPPNEPRPESAPVISRNEPAELEPPPPDSPPASPERTPPVHK